MLCDGENISRGDEKRCNLFCNATNFELLTFANFANQNRGDILLVFDEEIEDNMNVKRVKNDTRFPTG